MMAEMELDDETVHLAEYHVFKSIIDISKLCKTKPPEYSKCYSKFVEDNSLVPNAETRYLFCTVYGTAQ